MAEGRVGKEVVGASGVMRGLFEAAAGSARTGNRKE
jgi:hypothetical protein